MHFELDPMYRHNQNQLEFEAFKHPFKSRLDTSNRWVKLASLIPWNEFEEYYQKSLAKTRMGSPAKSVRMALGALIIKEKPNVSDEECVEQIRENPYLQYFIGLKEFTYSYSFNPSMFVHFRKRFSDDVMLKINEIICQKASKPKSKDDDQTKGDGTGHYNKGKLIVDAACAPSDITYPTDLKLLNKAREKTEKIIDVLHKNRKTLDQKPRTYRKVARKDYLSVAKSKHAGIKKIRRCIRHQLGYLSRNLKNIDMLATEVSFTNLNRQQYKDLLVISELYRQQQWMHDKRSRRIDDRIVSISQPHVRPIKRGKESADTEFGAKIAISLVDGYSFVDRASWDNFNEGVDLIDQIESYKKRFGVYPASVHADKIYRNRNNLRYCKEFGIRLSGPRLGRPPKVTEENAKQLKSLKKQTKQDELDRNAVEGKFGQGKRRYGLGRIFTKLSGTSKTSIIITFMVMNLEKWLRAILSFVLFKERRLTQNNLIYNLIFAF